MYTFYIIFLIKIVNFNSHKNKYFYIFKVINKHYK